MHLPLLLTIEDNIFIHHHHLNGEHYPSQECPIYQSFRYEQVNRIEDEVFWRKDGKPIRVEYISTPIYDGVQLVGAVVIFRDITERKESERKLREALDERPSVSPWIQIIPASSARPPASALEIFADSSSSNSPSFGLVPGDQSPLP